MRTFFYLFFIQNYICTIYVLIFKRNNISNDGNIFLKKNENQNESGYRSATALCLSIGFDWCILFQSKYRYIGTFIPAVFLLLFL